MSAEGTLKTEQSPKLFLLQDTSTAAFAGVMGTAYLEYCYRAEQK